jgi:hypothetical protein
LRGNLTHYKRGLWGLTLPDTLLRQVVQLEVRFGFILLSLRFVSLLWHGCKVPNRYTIPVLQLLRRTTLLWTYRVYLIHLLIL